jgi:hypothetical protein
MIQSAYQPMSFDSESDIREYVAFARAVRATIESILDSLARNPIVSGPPAPKDWPETQAILRNAADELMLCRDVRTAVEKLRDYPPVMHILPLCLTELEDESLVQIMQSAFLAKPGKSECLPGQAIATFLLEIAKCESPPLFRQD